jgi:hypothetical protein
VGTNEHIDSEAKVSGASGALTMLINGTALSEAKISTKMQIE